MKSYDIVGNIYLSYIALEYDLIGSANKRLYLINSLANDEISLDDIKDTNNRLIDISIVKTDETSPTLSRLHKDILCNVVIQFRTLNFLIDETAIASLLRYVQLYLVY